MPTLVVEAKGKASRSKMDLLLSQQGRAEQPSVAAGHTRAWDFPWLKAGRSCLTGVVGWRYLL